MTNEEVKRNIWRNSVSNYICMGLKLVLGVVMFRLLYQGLSKEEFGFWSLMWSVFGYGILLDFGFGFTAEKRVAELTATAQWAHLSRVLSTIFFVYLGIGVIIVLPALLFSHWMIRFFGVSPANSEHFRWMLIIFFLGMGVTFPLGIFPEILIGQQKIATVNWIFAASSIANFVGLALAFHFHWDLMIILTFGLLSGILPCVACAILGLRSLPEVRIDPRLFSAEMIFETTRFSIFAYFITVSNIILTKTAQVVISSVLSVAAIAVYQAGAKLGEMFGTFAGQLPATFSPVAAHLHAKGDTEFLRRLLINGTRLSVMIATPAYLIGAFYMEGMLHVLTGTRHPDPETFWTGQVLLLWGYSSLITHGVTKRIFVMCGHERRLTLLTVAEATLNLALSIGLIMYFRNVLCVAIAALVATLIIGWCFLWPWAVREARVDGLALARVVLFPVWLGSLPLIGFLIAGRVFPWLDFRTNMILFMAEAVVAGVIALAGLWRWALEDHEKAQLFAFAARRLPSLRVV